MDAFKRREPADASGTKSVAHRRGRSSTTSQLEVESIDIFRFGVPLPLDEADLNCPLELVDAEGESRLL